MSDHDEPKLAPPGAGLPKIELFIGRQLFALRCWTGSRESFNARFQQERQLIRELLKDRDAKSVLIARCQGLEDSRRYWSVWMTLDHLRIVNLEVIKIIGALTKGVVPPGTASTATVKPSASVTASVAAEYEASCDALLAAVAAVPDLKTKVRFPNPWFGPMDAWAWHALAGGHMGIHRVQLQRIFDGLRAAA